MAKKAVKSNKKATPKKAPNYALISVILLALSIFLFISLCTPLTGIVGTYIQYTVLGLLGIAGYAIPFFLLIIFLCILFSRRRIKQFSILFIIITVIFAAVYNVFKFQIPEFAENQKFVGYFVELTQKLFVEGYSTATSGGVLGGYIAVPLTALCSKVGAIIILFVILAVAVVLILKITINEIERKNKKDKLKAEKEKNIKVENKAIAHEIKSMRKDINDLRTKHSNQNKDIEKVAKTAAQEAAQQTIKGMSKSKNIESQLDEIAKPYEDAAKKSKNGKNKDVEPANLDPTITEGEIDEDFIAGFGVRPRRKSESSGVDTIVDDPLKELIIKKVNEAEERERQKEEGTYKASPKTSKQDKFALGDGTTIEDLPEEEEDNGPSVSYVKPPYSLLKVRNAAEKDTEAELEEIRETSIKLIDALKSYNVETKLINVSRGPSITRYELQPLPGVRISRITNLADDIALQLAATGVRIEAPIPGKAAVGIEIQNKSSEMVYLGELISSSEYEEAKGALSVCLGKDIAGNNVIIDLAKMPHLLIGGSTGSGKSVCINSILISLLYNYSPEDVRFILVDPKVVELNVYNGIPHLLIPVVTDPKKAAGALGWAVSEMLKRYELFKEKGVRDINGYNAHLKLDEVKMPRVVVIIDEMADLMMTSPNEVEDAIMRLAQMARAAGMHLVIATQRPSADVFTGTIKANIPSRIAFAVSSQVDSRIIIDMSGADRLVGKGDMLYVPLGVVKPQRVQGCFVSDSEVEDVVTFIKERFTAEYDAEVIKTIEENAKAQEKGNKNSGDQDDDDDEDIMLPQAIELVVAAGQASTSNIQRHLKLGYARAARIMDQMEERGIIGPYQGSKPRDVLITREQWLEIKNRMNGKF